MGTRILAGLAALTFSLSAFAQGDLQVRVDYAFQLIMGTQMGKQICNSVLNDNSKALSFNLGISQSTADQIVATCKQNVDPSFALKHKDWTYNVGDAEIQKLTQDPNMGRKYLIDVLPTTVPVESWTDPFSNLTFIFPDNKGEPSLYRLVQLLSHEMAVYFDSKANPAHPDAQKLPALQNLNLLVTSGKMDPLVAISDPLIAHTMTFVRALKVEYAVVDELTAKGLLQRPHELDAEDANLRQYISDEKCADDCLKALIKDMHEELSPIALPLLAYAPSYRSSLQTEMLRLYSHQTAVHDEAHLASTAWDATQWAAFQQAIKDYPIAFFNGTIKGAENLSVNMQRIFDASRQNSVEFTTVSRYMDADLWTLEQDAIFNARTIDGKSLLMFMKEPLLSGDNISLSSGPRVRIRMGNP